MQRLQLQFLIAYRTFCWRKRRSRGGREANSKAADSFYCQTRSNWNNLEDVVDAMAEKNNNGFFQQFLSTVQDFAEEATRERNTRQQVPSGMKKKIAPKAQPTNKALDAEPELVSETKPPLTPVIEMPKEGIAQTRDSAHEEDWEVLSERVSNRSIGGEVLVARAGSVRSIDHESSSHTTLSVPFKIQRTTSSSTLDSQDNVLGPSGKGILGVDYVEHVILPADTLQGVCLAYKVSASHLRRANHFSGNSLHYAPKKLLIPLSKQALRTGFIRIQDTDTKEYKLSYFQAEYPDVSLTEAKAYLELADWELKEALQSAKEDREWENEEGDTEDLKSGQIGVHINFTGGKPLLNLKGIGQSIKKTLSAEKITKKGNVEQAAEKHKIRTTPKVVVHAAPPAIETKSVLAEDLFNAAPQHNSYGFELKVLPKRSLSPESP